LFRHTRGNKKAPSDEPFGKWEIDEEKIEKDSRYVKNKADYDLAFCTVKPNKNGQNVGTVTGTLAIDPFDRSVKSWTGMGFPGVEPYDGQKLWRCKGDTVPNLGVLTKEDNLTKGASGGPWFAGSTTDRVNGLYATGADDRKSACSPKFDSWVLALYKKAFP
jgi:V8-like Glu-specific endopeptidase